MPLFRPRAPCPHCGKKSTEPRDPSDYLCPHCGQPGPWASPDQISAWQQGRAKQEKERRGLSPENLLNDRDGDLPARLA